MGSSHIKEVNCRCGATLQWNDLRKAWYCIECSFNTFPKNAESFSADEQKACHRCGNTEKDGKLWWVGSRKGFICGGCSEGGRKYRAESTDKTKCKVGHPISKCEECGAKICLCDSSCPDCGIIPDGITDVPWARKRGGIRRPPKKVLNVCQECWGDLPEEGPPLNCSYCGHYPICDTCSTDEMPYEAKSGKLTSRGSHSKICHRCRLRIKFNSESFSAESSSGRKTIRQGYGVVKTVGPNNRDWQPSAHYHRGDDKSSLEKCDNGCSWELGYVKRGREGVVRNPTRLDLRNKYWWDIHIYCPFCGTTLEFQGIPENITKKKATYEMHPAWKAESFSVESGCANCDKQSHFTHEDLPVGPRSFCSEKCWAEYVGMPIHPEGYYGFVGNDLSLSAESTKPQGIEELQKIQKELAVERTELSELRSEFSAKRTAMSGIRTLLAIGTFILVVVTFKHQTDTNS